MTRTPKTSGSDLRPPPYRLFDGWPDGTTPGFIQSPDGSTSFEPSAVALERGAKGQPRLLVLNDFYDPEARSYRLTRDGDLRMVAHGPIQLDDAPAARFAPKFEAVTALRNGRFLATTPFNRPGPELRQVMFLERRGGKMHASLAAHDTRRLEEALSAYTGKPWVQIEGLEVDAKEKNVFFGIRFVGENRDDPDKRTTVLLARCPLFGRRIGAPEQIFELSTERALAALGLDHTREGLSDFHREKDGSWLVLTSYEGNDFADPGNNAGHLFRISAADFAAAQTSGQPLELGPPIAAFRAKPEGVTTMADGRLIVDLRRRPRVEGQHRRLPALEGDVHDPGARRHHGPGLLS